MSIFRSRYWIWHVKEQKKKNYRNANGINSVNSWNCSISFLHIISPMKWEVRWVKPFIGSSKCSLAHANIQWNHRESMLTTNLKWHMHENILDIKFGKVISSHLLVKQKMAQIYNFTNFLHLKDFQHANLVPSFNKLFRAQRCTVPSS